MRKLTLLLALLGSVGCYMEDEDPYAQGGSAGGEAYAGGGYDYGYGPQQAQAPEAPQQAQAQAATPQVGVTTTVEAGAEPPLSGDQLGSAILAGIQVVSPTERVLSTRARDLFFSYFGPSLPEPLQMVPEQRGGQTVGLRIRGMAPDRVLAGMGFRNDDLVVAVDGQPIRSPVDALTAFSALRTAGGTVVQLERGGAPVTLRYRVGQ